MGRNNAREQKRSISINTILGHMYYSHIKTNKLVFNIGRK